PGADNVRVDLELHVASNVGEVCSHSGGRFQSQFAANLPGSHTIPPVRAIPSRPPGRAGSRVGDQAAGGHGRIYGMRWRNYVAVGDSFTEGLVDPDPAGHGYRGWADLVANRLAREYHDVGQDDAGFRYANLAVRGRLFGAIVDQQIPEVLRMRPDLVSFAGGGNDVLRPGFDAARMLTRFEEVVRMLRANDADVILFRWVDVSSRLPGRRVIRPRMQLLNRAVEEVAHRHG